MKQQRLILCFVGIAIIVAILGNSKSLVVWTQWMLIGDPKEEILDKTYNVGKYQIRERIHKFSGFPDSVYDYKYTRTYTIRENSFWSLDIGRFEYTDRRQFGIQATNPKIVGDWLVIFSDQHTFLWKHNHRSIQFWPDEIRVPELAKTSIDQFPVKSITKAKKVLPGQPPNIFPDDLVNKPLPKLINKYIHYQAMDFHIKGNYWFLEYQCNQDCQRILNNQLTPQLKCPDNPVNPSQPLLTDCALVPSAFQKFPNIIFRSDDQGKTFHIHKQQ